MLSRTMSPHPQTAGSHTPTSRTEPRTKALILTAIVFAYVGNSLGATEQLRPALEKITVYRPAVAGSSPYDVRAAQRIKRSSHITLASVLHRFFGFGPKPFTSDTHVFNNEEVAAKRLLSRKGTWHASTGDRNLATTSSAATTTVDSRQPSENDNTIADGTDEGAVEELMRMLEQAVSSDRFSMESDDSTPATTTTAQSEPNPASSSRTSPSYLFTSLKTSADSFNKNAFIDLVGPCGNAASIADFANCLAVRFAAAEKRRVPAKSATSQSTANSPSRSPDSKPPERLTSPQPQQQSEESDDSEANHGASLEETPSNTGDVNVNDDEEEDKIDDDDDDYPPFLVRVSGPGAVAFVPTRPESSFDDEYPWNLMDEQWSAVTQQDSKGNWLNERLLRKIKKFFKKLLL